MNHLSEYVELMTSRESMYRFLGRLYFVEVDENLFDQLKKMIFPSETGVDEMDEGYRLLKNYMNNAGLDPITDLAVDYARVFLGAGVYEGTVANPYESVYTSPERLIMQDARDEVLAAYLSKGLAVETDYNIPEDHISLEFEFMAHMCAEAKGALEDKNWAGFGESLAFLHNHLLNWVPDFCKDIETCSSTDFYQGLAKLTMGYLQIEKELLDELHEEILTGSADI